MKTACYKHPGRAASAAGFLCLLLFLVGTSCRQKSGPGTMVSFPAKQSRDNKSSYSNNKVQQVQEVRMRNLADAQNEEIAILYSVGMLSTGVANTDGPCVFPPRVTFTLQCGFGGRILKLDNDESLGLAECTTIDERTLVCTETSMHHISAELAAYVVFQCVSTILSGLQATASLQEDTVDCSGANLFGATYGRQLGIGLRCYAAAGVDLTTVEYFLEDVFCTSTNQQSGLTGYCRAAAVCTGTGAGTTGLPCGPSNTLVEIALEVRDNQVPERCIWEPADAIRNEDDDLPTTNVPQKATYQVMILGNSGLESFAGDICTIQDGAVATVTCGEGAQLFVLDTNDQTTVLDEATVAAFGCTYISNNVLECNANPEVLPPGVLLGDFLATIFVACQGTTAESWSVQIEFDPKYMVCTAPTISFLGNIATVNYQAMSFQFCPGLSNSILPSSNPFSQECSPVISTRLAGGGNSTDSTGAGIAIESCSVIRTNCLQGDVCDENDGQRLGPVRSSIPPGGVDVNCLTDGIGSVTNDKDGDGGGKEDIKTNGNPDSASATVHTECWFILAVLLAGIKLLCG